jgi:two-component system chemotaxis response regulator CheB
MNEDSSAVDVVAVGASAGGVEALTRLAQGLPENLPYAVLVALHMPVSGPSVLARILDRHGTLPAVTASHGAVVRAGKVYVAVPNRHLLLDGDRLAVSAGPTENGHRPAINALFRSVALSRGTRGVGLLLSGVLDDGVLGLAAIRSRGGTTLVQDPADALFPGMPLNALEADVVDQQVTAADVGELLVKLSERQKNGVGMSERRTGDPEAEARLELENRIAMGGPFSTSIDAESLGPPSGYTCPDCNGSLLEVSDRNYRCHVGHAWTADSLLRARDDEVEGAMWVAVRSLQEKTRLSRKLAHSVGPGIMQDRYDALADEAEHAMTVLSRRLSDAYPAGRGRRDE